MLERNEWTYFEGYVYLLLWHVSACQVHARLDADELLACLDQLGGEIGGSAASIPTDR